ncbi:hypothetical protein ACH0AH_04030 [Microbacterium paludicola]|uniref:hypothetical protein n=1 Tax=Microbacterium paludicola TaxID=300019 RepID=UPI00387A29BB
MATGTLSRMHAVIAAIVLVLAMLMPALPAAADGPAIVPAAANGNGNGNGPAGCGSRTCDVGDGNSGDDGNQGEGNGDQGSDEDTGSTGGGEPPKCYSGDREVPCSVGGWTWYSPRNCYITPVDPQPAEGQTPEGWHPPMLGAGEGPGTWYHCGTMYCEPLHLMVGPCAPGFVWIADGEPTIDPGVAAAAVLARLTVEPIDIGMAPRTNPEWGHRRTHVGVPVWMWVANPGQGTSQGWSVSDSEGGLAVTGTMRITSFQWNMGDGTTVTCGTAGQPYQAGFGWRESPDCGHVYSRTSADQPGDRFTVTETTNWVFDWTAGGRSGSIPLTTTSTTRVEVNELQTVNTSPAG